MNIIAGLGEYILQTHSTTFFEDSMGVEPPIPLLGTPVCMYDDDDERHYK